ncbi:MAG: hybrid sensor histidine kinase/response regulator [Candidatus Riflebacteria bacterium]|nr:hybrid sensor histidine kinase/response regulator [Candidatus Riflebacteria bacterium]
MTPDTRFNVLIADDEPRFCEILEDLLASEDVNLYSVNTPENAIKAVLNYDIHLALLDKRFPTDNEGLQTLRRVKEIKPDTEIIMMTAYPDTESNLDAVELGVYSYLPKTMDYEKMQKVLKRLFHVIKQKRQNTSLLAELEERNNWLESISNTVKGWNEKLIRRVKAAEDGGSSVGEDSDERFLPPDNIELFAVALVHELNNHLQIINIVLSDLAGESTMSKDESIKELCEVTSQLSKITESYSQIFVGSESKKKQPANLELILQYVFKAAWRLAQSRDVLISRQVALSDKEMMCQSRLLSDALLNIMKNAVEAASPYGNEEAAKVLLQAYRTGSGVVIEVGNTGAPIDEDILKKLFVGMSQKDGHLGVGLCLASYAIEKHGGTIELKRRNDTWNIFQIRFPIDSAGK